MGCPRCGAVVMQESIRLVHDLHYRCIICGHKYPIRKLKDLSENK